MQPLTPKEIVQSLVELGLTQLDIRRETGISQASISRILTGKLADPRVSVAQALRDLHNKVKEKSLEEKA
ncbi:transcriptional regulator [Serratia sp. JSRIV002]|jgi:predicted transcriptional regulator|uniref:helix-turn-helix transcriptional regulator n=1 Tax=Serratia TaxID=613 RepID=UPI001CBAD50F|nr:MULTISPECIES: helix-turn-helix transcriptional regulator [Serratia]MCO7511388.1 transcriptional regulator [Serratia fonticola]UAN49174.1 transcriptional regulator [Serratia sp. JSRIV002]